MATVWKILMGFKLDDATWTESWYWANGPDTLTPPPASAVNVPFVLQAAPVEFASWYNVFKARALMLANTASMQVVRFSKENVPAACWLDRSVVSYPTSPVGSPRDLRRRSIKAEARFGAELRWRRTVTLGGVRDLDVNYTLGGQPSYAPNFKNQFDDYAAKLFTAGASIKAQRSAVLGNLYLPIEQIVQTGTPPALFIKSTGHGLSVGDEVRIHGVKLINDTTQVLDPYRIDGIYFINLPVLIPDYPSADWFLIAKNIPFPFIYLGPGKVQDGFNEVPRAWVQKRSFTYEVLVELTSDDVYFGQRKRRSTVPLGSSPGRSRGLMRLP